MLNLHPPFRRCTPDDAETVQVLLGDNAAAHPAEAVLAEENGTVTAVLDGRPSGEGEDATWRIDALAVASERASELGPRILAVADALAADDGLLSVTLDARELDPALRAILDQEGFRPVEGTAGLLVRPVIPQG